MTSDPQSSSTSNLPKRPVETSGQWWYLFSGLMLLVFVLEWRGIGAFRFLLGRSTDPQWEQLPAPLVMQGGDPHIRALMRTISASESNSPRPYSLLYGGEHFHDFSQHPDRCVTIVAGPNTGDCTTAAGRYQMLTTTWLSKAEEYHPQNTSFLFWESYSFAPLDQDEVVYQWLDDPQAWGVDLAHLLRQGQIDEVLQILSPTWTSLGYGIEPNSMTASLPQIYEEMLQQELQGSASLVGQSQIKQTQNPEFESNLLDTPLREILSRLLGPN